MAFKAAAPTVVTIPPANIVETSIQIVGTAPYVQARFSEKAKQSMHLKHEAGSTGKVGRSSKAARDFEAEYTAAQHIAEEGWNGIPAVAFRAAMIDACRTVGLEMTRAKMAVFIIADGLDAEDGTPLVRIIGAPEMHEAHTRNATGVADLRIRPMWRKWTADVRIQFDADILTSEHVVNLLSRAGRQVGIGEGRPFSKKSVGQGWGTFDVMTERSE